MTIGGSIALIVIGAILRFAISWSPSTAVNVQLIGVILMIAGAVGLIISLTFLMMRRQRSAVPPAEVVERRRYADPPVVERRQYAQPDVIEERRYTEPPV